MSNHAEAPGNGLLGGKELSAEFVKIEQLAVELAGIAGSEITRGLGEILAVRYKNTATAEIEAEAMKWRDPVSEVDQRIEDIIRQRLAEHFPSHDIIGEEMAGELSRNHDFVWVIDPIDGTANFVNGFPMFAASIGVLYQSRPVIGALWCSTSHALRHGVYHATVGSKLRFEGADVTPKVNAMVRRNLAGVPELTRSDAPWETRKTGSAAIECAMVAAGLLKVARFASPNIWDVAGGLALVAASGMAARENNGTGWVPIHGFDRGYSREGEADLRSWRNPVIVGTPEAVERMCAIDV